MAITEFAAIIVAIAAVVAAVFLVTAVNNLNNTMAKLEDTAHQLRDEGISAFRELRQLVADADAELDKVDVVLDRADQATTAISETTRRTHEAAQDPMIRTLAVASGTGKVARLWLSNRFRKNRNEIDLRVEPSNGNGQLISEFDQSGTSRSVGN